VPGSRREHALHAVKTHSVCLTATAGRLLRTESWWKPGADMIHSVGVVPSAETDRCVGTLVAALHVSSAQCSDTHPTRRMTPHSPAYTRPVTETDNTAPPYSEC